MLANLLRNRKTKRETCLKRGKPSGVLKRNHGFRTLHVSEDNVAICDEKKLAVSPKKQRPPQSILRRKPAPKIDPPIKSEPKPSPSEPKIPKGVIKTVVPASSAGPSRKPEVKKPDEDKKDVLLAPVQPQEGHYELNARMTRMVEAELRDIMIKLWQELPDNPTDETEALVVDKLRNKAGDDLRNVLGLNITKRLLNVHNPLYVKVQFSGKPEKAHLGEFLKKYNFNAFKRIEKTVNMFAAQVKTINDFDRVCSAKDIRCGDIKVFVNPIYKFTKCPPNLITSFYDQDGEASDEAADIEKDVKRDAETEKNKSPEKLVPKQSDNVSPKVEASKTENVTKEIVIPKTAESKTIDNKPATENKTPVPKPENKAAVNKPAIENKAVPNKTAENKSAENPAVQNKNVINKPTGEIKTTVKPVANKTAGNKPAVANKTNDTKPSIQTKEDKKPQTNPKSNDTDKKPAPTPTKTSVKSKLNNPQKTNTAENDYDELDDLDILALMSEGIILDECSGSDDE